MAHYLDYAASAPLLDVARSAWLEVAGQPGNASSLHGAGRQAKSVVEGARERAAAALGTHPTELLWTAGGTESINAGIKGLYWSRNQGGSRPRIVVSATEHHAVLDAVQWLAARHGAEVTVIGVDRDGVIDLEALREDLQAHHDRTALVAVMWANNEVGTVQPIESVVEIATEYEVPVHVDAVQAVGACDVDLSALGATSVALSAHKWGGPGGVGLWWLDRTAQVDPLLHGGGQERSIRSGTVNAAGAHAAAAALDFVLDRREDTNARLRDFQRRLFAGLESIAGVRRTGPEVGPELLPGIVHCVIEGARSEPLLFVLDSMGIYASNGAACTAGVVQPSHVVSAMGYSDTDSQSTLRLSMGVGTTEDDVDAALTALPTAVERARAAA